MVWDSLEKFQKRLISAVPLLMKNSDNCMNRYHEIAYKNKFVDHANKGICIMNKLANRIKHHQVVAFFIITFVISWGLGIPGWWLLTRVGTC